MRYHCVVILSLDNVAHDARLLLLFRLTADVLEHLVHLLQRLTGSLRDDEECEDESEKTEDCEESVCAVAGVLDKRGSDETL